MTPGSIRSPCASVVLCQSALPVLYSDSGTSVTSPNFRWPQCPAPLVRPTVPSSRLRGMARNIRLVSALKLHATCGEKKMTWHGLYLSRTMFLPKIFQIRIRFCSSLVLHIPSRSSTGMVFFPLHSNRWTERSWVPNRVAQQYSVTWISIMDWYEPELGWSEEYIRQVQPSDLWRSECPFNKRGTKSPI